MNIVVAVNNAYVKPLKVMFSSLLTHNKECIHVFILQTERLLDSHICEIKSVLGNRGDIHLIDVPTIECNTRFSSASLSRIIAPFYLPLEISRVLYLDADILIRKPIKQLYDMDMSQKSICAIPDYACDTEDGYHMQQLELRRPKHYVNSGVLLVDLNRFREKYNLQELLDGLKTHNAISSFIDQDFINDYFRDDIQYVDVTYNQPALWSAPKSAVIVHYIGEKKPWKTNYDLKFFFEYKKVWNCVNRNEKLSVFAYIKNIVRKLF